MSTLGAVLQGMDRGVMNGLNLYKTVQDEARQKRLDHREIQRDRRRDMEADRLYDAQQQEFGYKKERDGVADQQWQDNFQFSKDKHADDVKYQQGSLAVSQGTLALANRRFDDAVGERNRIQSLENATNLFKSSLIGEDGQYITDNAQFADRVNGNPQALKAMLDVAAGNGLIDPKRVEGYTGAQLVNTPKGLALRVAGKDANGKPIKEGGGILSENGTDDPNDPYVLLNVGQLRQMVDPKFRDAQQSDALARGQIEAGEQQVAQTEAAQLASFDSAAAAATAEVEQGRKRIAELQAEREKLPTQVSRPALAGGIGGGAGIPMTNPRAAEIENEIASLSATVRDKEGSIQQLASRRESVPVAAEAQRQSIRDSVSSTRQLYGENYATQQRTLAAAAPAAQKEALKASSTRYDKVVENSIKDNVVKPKKGEPPPKVSAAELRTMLNNVDPAIVHRVGSNRRYEAAVSDVVRHAAEKGITGDLGLMLEASATGVDLDAYAELIASPQLANLDLTQRHARAMEVAKAKAADPSKDVGTLAGAALMPR